MRQNMMPAPDQLRVTTPNGKNAELGIFSVWCTEPIRSTYFRAACHMRIDRGVSTLTCSFHGPCFGSAHE